MTCEGTNDQVGNTQDANIIKLMMAEFNLAASVFRVQVAHCHGLLVIIC